MEQAKFVTSIREIEKALGDGVKQPTPSERTSELRFRKSLYFSCDKPAGDLITPEDCKLAAPGFGLLPKFRDYIVGRRLTRSVEAGSPVLAEDLL